MKKPISYVIVFILGFTVCAAIFKWSTKSADIATVNTPTSFSPAIARKGDDSVAVAAAKVEKSVVNIDTEGRPSISQPDIFGFMTPQEVIPKGQASGVIIRKDGYILTNNHVIANTSKVYVTLWNNKRYPANIIGRDSKSDLAVIKVKENNLPAATINEAAPRVGDWVIAIGNALGLGTTVTVGVVSATDRGQLNIEGTILENAIQTDAAINRGNSGGALADINGNIIGINTAIASTSPGGGSIGIGFAIPSKTAKWVADQIIQHGKVVRPWLGISYIEINGSNRQALQSQLGQLPPVDGAMIREVMQGSPAEKAGLAPLDVITKINGKSITNAKTISETVQKSKIGDIIDLTVWHARNSKTSRIAVRAGEMPAGL
ncbi:MAG: trypsin-like peptidase domain-containing protein [Armatimonadota bacterium]